MEKALAEVILKSVLGLGKELNGLDPIVRDVKDADERRRLLKCLGVVMSELNAGIILPIINQYPEMDPDPRRPVRMPLITGLIILINVFVFLRELTRGEPFVLRW